MLRSRGVSALTTSPPIRMSPDVTSSSPAIMRSRVDLPQPEGPTSATKARSSMASETRWMTSTTP